jgi:hypothetical protein
LEARHAEPHPGGLDRHYDGVLATPNATTIIYRDESDIPPKGVYFSSTLYKGGSPTMSPYPTDGDKGQKYWSVSVPIQRCNLHNCSLFCVTECDKKALLAFVPNEDQKWLSWFRGKREHGVKEIDKGDNKYMFLFKGNWYCPKYPGGRWIKVFLPFSVDISGAEWFRMERMANTTSGK